MSQYIGSCIRFLSTKDDRIAHFLEIAKELGTDYLKEQESQK